MNTFSSGAAVSAGWKTFKSRPWFFVGVTVLVAVISGISGQVTNSSHVGNGQTIILFGVGFVITIVISLLVKMGTINVYLKAQQDAQVVRFEDLWAPQRAVSFFLATLLVGVIVVVGLILLIVPGIMWALRYMFVPYLVMDKGLDVTSALAESARITYGHKWQLLGLVFLMVLLNILGAICLLVGLLVTIPVSALATVHAYRTLSKSA